MKKSVAWNYRPYRPFFFEVGDIYICRIAPDDRTVHFEWLDDDNLTYTVHYRKKGDENYSVIENVTGSEYTVTNLESNTDYEFFVSSGEKKSRVRLAKTAKAVGTVVNYLHPEDTAYEYSGRALCSPSLIRLTSGVLLASMDLFAPGAPQNLTLVYRSEDNGATWHYQNELFPCYWAKMFLHRGELYMLGVSNEYGDLLIGKSTDEGRTYEAPTVIMRGSCSCKTAGIGRTPQNIFEHKGRLYTSFEWGAWAVGYHAACIISCDADGDLLDADNWKVSYPLKFDPTWEGVEPYPSNGMLEGTVTLAPDGKLVAIYRYDMTKTEVKYGKILSFEIDPDDPTAPIKYQKTIKCDGHHSKFIIQKDEPSGYYSSIISRITDKNKDYDRRLLSLVRSKELDEFELVCDLYDLRDRAEWNEEGMQYVDFFFEGDDILFLSRTSMNGGNNFHDANYSTFHRIKNFRTTPTVE